LIRRQHKSAAMLETPQKGCEVRGGALAVTNQGKGVKSSHAADEMRSRCAEETLLPSPQRLKCLYN